MKIFIVITFLSVILSAKADNFAVLVAGSNGFWNYRHQADVCHAYQILRNDGIPAENIVTMSYDDVANNSENPFPGKLFNKPSKGPGVDVYEGCMIDYSKSHVTPANFVAILLGQADKVKGGNGKVLKSTENDNVFINFVDHGGPGVIEFPSEEMHRKKLVKALTDMHENNMYKELTFYLEACESGSMFTTLPDDINIFATTAANAKESSWGTYCHPDDKVDGKSIGSCLGDLYSVNWMEDTEAKGNSIWTETLLDQFKAVKKLTTKSHVEKFGQESMDSEPIGNFEGERSEGQYIPVVPLQKNLQMDVESRNIKLHYLMNRYERYPTLQNLKELQEEQDNRTFFDNTFEKMALILGIEPEKIQEALSIPTPLVDDDCHIDAMQKFKQECMRFSEYGMKYAKFLVTMCESGLQQDVIHYTIEKSCE